MGAPLAGDRERRRFMLLAALVALFGLGLRLLYVFGARIDAPIYGDGMQYMAYAWNVVNHGVYSSSAQLVPDSYRSPAYPLLLAAGLAMGGNDLDSAVRYAQILQALLGAATVLLTIALARLWLSRALALAAGLLVACWPHLITFAATLMSETLFGFLLVLAMFLTCLGAERSQRRWLAAGGLAFGAAYLANSVILLFPLALVLLLCRRGRFAHALVLLLAAAVVPVGWGWRNASLPGSAGEFHHAVDGFVWGSSPVYMLAFNSRWVSPEAKRIADLEQQETQRVLEDPAGGLAMIGQRMREDPLAYAAWYLLEKPYLLWDWGIVIGNGDIYYPLTRQSPFERIALLAAMKRVAQWINPLLFFLALAGAATFAWLGALRPQATAFVAAALALFFLYVTAIHAVFQAEPRYAIAYRPEQMVLALGFLAQLAAWLRAPRSGGAPKRLGVGTP